MAVMVKRIIQRRFGMAVAVLATVILLTSGLAGCWLLLLKPYRPVVFEYAGGGQRLVERPDLVCPEHLAAIRTILSNYGEFHLTFRGRLWISTGLANDIELLANYCEKAEILRTTGRSSPLVKPGQGESRR
jgi:hypothetical protein